MQWHLPPPFLPIAVTDKRRLVCSISAVATLTPTCTSYRYFAAFYFAINGGSFISTLVTPKLRADVHCFGRDDCFPAAFGVSAASPYVAHTHISTHTQANTRTLAAHARVRAHTHTPNRSCGHVLAKLDPMPLDAAAHASCPVLFPHLRASTFPTLARRK